MQPGPAYSVSDVSRGWVRGLATAGADVVEFTFGDRLWFFQNALVPKDGTTELAFEFDIAVRMAFEGLGAWILETRPDVVLFVSGFWLTPNALELARQAGCTTVLLCTESPYEDVRQLALAAHADICLLNDPVNAERFSWVCKHTKYVPHSYDPTVHRPGPSLTGRESDVVFVGTGYESRIKFFEQIDWDGIDLALLGNWSGLAGHALAWSVRQPKLDACVDNDQTVGWYQSAGMSINLYRRETEVGATSGGVAMTPREVELGAIGTFFITEERAENAEVLPFVPKFANAQEASDLIYWWLAHPEKRAEITSQTRSVLANWTFENRARGLLKMIDNLN